MKRELVKTSLLMVAAALFAAILSIPYALREAKEARAAHAVVHKIRAQQAEEEAEVHRLREEIANAERKQTALKADLAGLVAKPTEPRVSVAATRDLAAPVTAEEQWNEWVKKEREDQKRPARQLAELAVRRVEIAAAYGQLFHALNLAPKKIRQFEENAIRHAERQMDFRTTLQAHGVDLMDPAAAKLWVQIERDYQAAQAAALGEGDYRQFQEYERRAPLRDMVGKLAGAAITAGIPYSKKQTDEIIEVMANTDPNFSAGGKVSLISIDWNLVDARAKAILSDEQFTFFRTFDPSLGGSGGRTWSKLNRAMNNAIAAEEKAR